MDKIYSMLVEIHENPKKYLERANLRYLHTFLSGYTLCMVYTVGETFFNIYPGFLEFIQDKYNIKLSASDFNIIEFNCSDEEEAFHKYFELVDEFLKFHNKN